MDAQPNLNFDTPRNTQAAKILAWMAEGNRITALEALWAFRCFRLAARVDDLKKAGHNVVAEMVERNGKRVAEYRLEV